MIRSKDYSESTAQQIDTEVKRIIDEGYKVAKDIIDTHRDKLEKIANSLLEYETLDGTQVEEIVRTGTFQPPPSTPDRFSPVSGVSPSAEVPQNTPPKLEPGLGTPAPAPA
jgi:cell division protease FtsH